MVKKIVSDTFEQLGQTAGQAVQQIVQEPGKIAETAVQQTGIKSEHTEQPSSGQLLDPTQVAKTEAQRRMFLAAHAAELEHIKQQQAQELPKQISGKPGFSEEKAIKQLKEQQKPKELPVIAAAKKKGGTGERRSMGGSS